MTLTEIYVDPAINANSGTGTSGDPYGDLQHALNTATRDAINGDRFNVKAGTSEILAAALSWATYGTPTATAPCVIQGYTTTAGDGGIGVIDGNGSISMVNSSGANSVHFIDMRLTNTGTAAIITNIGTECSIQRCELDTSSSHGIAAMGMRSMLAGCNIHDVATNAAAARYAVQMSGVGSKILGNRIQAALGNTASAAINVGTINQVIDSNVIRIGNTGSGILNSSDGTYIANNSIYAAASTGQGIDSASGSDAAIILNNIIEGFSGTGGDGVITAGATLLYHSNALYNNATNETASGVTIVTANNDVLSGSAFVNAGSDDFDINGTVTGVTEDAWPSAFTGAASTAPKADKGAVQAGAGTGGGGTVNPLRGKLG